MIELTKKPLPTLLSLICCTLLLASCSSEPKYRFRSLPQEATVLAFGDSLTFGKGVDADQSYPVVLSELISRKVIRSGIPGETSGQGLKRLPEELRRYQPQLLVLCHGGNDILRRIDPNLTYSNLKQMSEMALAQGIQVVLVGVPTPSLSLSAPEAAAYYQQVAAELKLPLESEVLSEMLYDRSYKSDSVHLNAAGYRRLAETIAQMLKSGKAI